MNKDQDNVSGDGSAIPNSTGDGPRAQIRTAITQGNGESFQSSRYGNTRNVLTYNGNGYSRRYPLEGWWVKL